MKKILLLILQMRPTEKNFYMQIKAFTWQWFMDRMNSENLTPRKFLTWTIFNVKISRSTVVCVCAEGMDGPKQDQRTIQYSVWSVRNSSSTCMHLASWTHFHIKGRVWWTAYTSRVLPHHMVWSNHTTVSCHMTHYINIWVAITVLKMATESYMYYYKII